MAVTTLCSRSRAASTIFFRFIHGASSRHSLPISSDSAPASPDDINDISRVLSDFRGPQHDIESALTPFSSKLSTNLVEQVLKRTKNLGFSAHRFFLWAKKLPGFQPDVHSYRILIDVLGSSKQFPLIWDLLSEVKSGENFELCPEIFWVIFGAYCRANLPNDAIRAFNRMNEFGLEPSLNDLDHLLYLLCRKKFVKDGQEFFDRIKGKFDPSVKSYTILIRGWGDVGNSEEARKVFDEMLERGCVVDVPAYNSLLEALCNGGDLDEAYAMFRAMESKGLAPDACTYSIFIRSYCKRDNIHSVFRVLDRMKRYELVPNLYTYNCIIKKLCSIEKVEDAHQLLDEMIEGGVSPDTWSYNTIMAFHCDRNEVNRAVRLLSRMEKENCKPDRHTWNMLLKMLIRVGRFDKVEEVWGSMPRKGFYPSVSTYAVMIHGFLKKKGKLDDAIKYFEMMIDEGIPPYSSTIEQLRNRFVGWGMMEKVEILADKMEASSSSSIKELSKTMRGHRSHRRRRRREDESSESSEEEWPFMPDAS
ncbi:pentatricopeptide repeat-containing protein At1g52640, mitochondrial [Chenopodium quinoa]|uniref:Pentatricopeptide repeat-containing protein n=1 Tax=Chenopodium quinoa TaxID=63459 RepID=A0A803LED4_CHEQI|nr:pentatricopeptide repeat-containing protein At1g52640, mitochondrial [Chenopodium quinoa]